MRQNLSDAPNQAHAAAREAVRFSAFVLPKQVEVFHQHEGYFGLEDEDNIFVRSPSVTFGFRF